MDITASFTPVRNLSAAEVRKWVAERDRSGFTLLDVRQPAEYESGHIPGAVLVPLAELPGRMKEIDASRPAVVYCRSGNRSHAATALLGSSGLTAYNMEGGMLAWNGSVASGPAEAGIELVRGRTTPEQFACLAWALEEGAAAFYRVALDGTTDDKAQAVFRSLLEAEEGHKQKVLQAAGIAAPGCPPGDRVREALKGMMEGGFSVDAVADHLRSRGFSLRDVLETAMQLEANSLDLYLKASRWTEAEAGRAVFTALIGEEQGHLARLGALLNEAARTA